MYTVFQKHETGFLLINSGHKEAIGSQPISYENSYPLVHFEYQNFLSDLRKLRYWSIFSNSKMENIDLEDNNKIKIDYDSISA